MAVTREVIACISMCTPRVPAVTGGRGVAQQGRGTHWSLLTDGTEQDVLIAHRALCGAPSEVPQGGPCSCLQRGVGWPVTGMGGSERQPLSLCVTCFLRKFLHSKSSWSLVPLSRGRVPVVAIVHSSTAIDRETVRVVCCFPVEGPVVELREQACDSWCGAGTWCLGSQGTAGQAAVVRVGEGHPGIFYTTAGIRNITCG